MTIICSRCDGNHMRSECPLEPKTMSYNNDSMKLEADRNARLEDLLRNIAGLDDSNLFISSHAILVVAVKEWRKEARNLVNHLANEDPSGQRREATDIGWLGDIGGNPFGPSDR